MKPWMRRLEIPRDGDGLVVFWEDIWISAEKIVPPEFLEFWEAAFDCLDIEEYAPCARRSRIDTDYTYRSEIRAEDGILALADAVTRK